MKRNNAIDLAKGVAIMLVVIGHCYSTRSVVNQVISAFHMPFFFIGSGILYADKWNEEIRFNFKKTEKSC